MVIVWDGAPMHRRHRINAFLAHGVAQRLHVERLPAYAPELHPAEGRRAHLKGVDLQNACCFNLGDRCKELRDAVKRVGRQPRWITGLFGGAKL